MDYYTIDENYLLSHPYCEEAYSKLIASIEHDFVRCSYTRTFVMAIDDVRSNMQQIVGYKPPKEDLSATPEQFWYNRIKRSMNVFRSTKECRYISVVVTINGKHKVYEQPVRPHLPEPVIDFVERMFYLKSEYQINILNLSTQGCKEYDLRQKQLARYELMRCNNHHAIFSTTDMMHDEFGLSHCDVSRILIWTREPSKMYFTVTKVYTPSALPNNTVKIVHDFEPLYHILDKYTPNFLYSTLGYTVRRSSFPFPVDRHPAKGEVLKYNQRSYYSLTDNEISNVLKGNIID